MTNARKTPIPFEIFASFKRIETGNPIISLPPPLLGGGDPCDYR